MKNISSKKLPATRMAADNLILLTGNGQFLSFKAPIWMTRTLWRSLTGKDEVQPDDTCLDDLFFYLLFALAGMIGFDHHRSVKSHTLLIPVAFEKGGTKMRITSHHEPGTGQVLTLSLPEERIA